ncbi:MAG: excinuclease ABC subunit B [Zetaproteobacteria bacterium]|nr:excinuclease ABC subunit B [Pseudobdellovibrionaceae bacterium]
MPYNLKAKFSPSGDQPKAISDIVKSFTEGASHHCLMGVTGSGKTFTVANVIKNLDRSALIIAPNKTLAAQLYTEFKGLFPEDPVGFFISYYDYYQPEAYVPSTDTYIAKDSSINDDIDKMRHECTRLLFEEKKVIIVASVSCIYGLGSPEAYAGQIVSIKKDEKLARDDFLKSLVEIQYARNDQELKRGHFRVRGDTVDLLPAHSQDELVRLEFFDDKIERILLLDAFDVKKRQEISSLSLYPNSHYVPNQKEIKDITHQILVDLGEQLRHLNRLGKKDESKRLEDRVMQDVEALEELGFCPGIENYSRYLTGKAKGAPPPCLLDYFPKDFLTIIDESHISISQIGGMYKGDQSRKKTLVDFGFRLPSALDNRPLSFDEFFSRCHQILYVSATPGRFEHLFCDENSFTEQIIRPTGLIDPMIEIRKKKNPIDDLHSEINQVIADDGRVLVTCLTKKMAEDLSQYFTDLKIPVKYLHADIDSLRRLEILKELRTGEIKVLIGINLLREGLDLPETKLVAIMDADKEGFLRSKSSLIQTIGRAARNEKGRVLFYADRVTDSMKEAMEETKRRRDIQESYNKKHSITPKSIVKPIAQDLRSLVGIMQNESEDDELDLSMLEKLKIKNQKDLEKHLKAETKKMKKHASRLEFEKACEIRDEIKKLKSIWVAFGEKNS